MPPSLFPARFNRNPEIVCLMIEYQIELLLFAKTIKIQFHLLNLS
jgi:hypothetical protein